MSAIDYGVCRLSLIPVRKDPDHTSEQVTQLLFGEHYEVLDVNESKPWIRIHISFDQYEGWIHKSQHHTVSKEYFDYINRTEFKITTDLTSSLLYNKSPQIILMGSIIPISSSELFKMEEQFAFNGDAKNLGQKREFDYLQNIARKYINAPYQWGGRSPFGLDCSGFVQMVFKICGYPLHRDARQQALQGKSLDGNSPAGGDLVFFRNMGKSEISHVGILLAPDKVIHAHGRVRIDHFSADGIMQAETKIFTHEFAHARRIISDHG